MTGIKLTLLTVASSIFFSFGAYAQLNFAPIHYYSTAKFSSGHIAIGDLNNDGKPDIVTALRADQKVALLMNSGNGTFDTPVLYSVEIDDPSFETPWGIALGDVNGDSFLDIVTTNPAYHPPHGKMSVLINNGNGTFATSVSYETNYYPTVVILKDLNGDDKLDAVTANYADTSISILMNNGDGTFAPQVASYATGPNPIAITSADFDGDGSSDLALTNSEGGLILKNNGSGIFSQGPVVPSLSSDYKGGDIVAADLNGDNKPDLVVSTRGLDKKFSVFINNGNGNFNAPISYPYTKEANKIVAVDMNNDGKLDLVIASGNAPFFNDIYLNDGTGTFGTPIKVPCQQKSIEVAVADLNSDGRPDLVNATSFADSCSVVLQTDPIGTGVNTVGTSPSTNIKLFPNPGKSNVAIVSPVNDLLKIHDATGRLLETYKIREGTNNIDTKDLSAGMYLFEIAGQALKFEKEK